MGLIGRRIATTADGYFLGLRNLGPAVTGCALGAAWLSGWASLGGMGMTYTAGWSGVWFAGIWTIVGMAPCVFLVARKLSEFSHHHGARTLGDIIQVRYGSKAVTTIAAAAMAILSFLYTIGQLKAAGTAWYAVTGFPPVACLLLGMVVMLVYLLFGGYTGTQWAMALQGVFLAAAVSVLSIFTFSYVGWGEVLNAKLAAQDPKLLLLVRPEMPHVGSAQLFSDLVGVTACALLF
ncbi:MAG: hypothetical protein H5T99_13245, partial [Moorella sp. (in: Bacteria)]|nr:hypothetical protein [Moorella sp. (in: firmicutes)]